MNKKEQTYESAIKELQQVVNELRDEMVNMDDLTSKVNRAKELIEYCQQKLRSVGEDLKGIF
ncbi:MAG: exodeoxyribonuclease VII small subunit [Bacteroidota bacterium]